MGGVRCLLCGEPVVGFVALIPPTICCYSCCKSFDGHHHCLVKLNTKVVLASVAHLVCRSDLVHIQKKEFREGGVFYLAAEVFTLAKLRSGDLNVTLQERLAVTQKKEALEQRLRFSLKYMDPVLRPFLLEDYLSRSFGTKTRVEDVERRFAVLSRVEAIRRDVEGAYPPAVFDFCIGCATADSAGYRQSMEKCQAVLDVEGPRILGKLDFFERERLRGTALESTLKDFQKQTFRAELRSSLEKFVTPDMAQDILIFQGFQARLKYAGGAEGTTARRLVQAWDDVKIRDYTLPGLVKFLRTLGSTSSELASTLERACEESGI